MTHSSFNPSMVDPERLERVLVARHHLLASITERIQTASDSGNCPAIVLVGPRGMGKSHMVALVAHRLKQSDPERTKLAIAWLEEDPWKIQTYFDLLCAVLRALEGSVAEQSLRRDTRNELHDPERREAEAVRRIQQAVGARTLVVMVENLPTILENLGTEGQRKWRALLQNSKHWALLATAPALSRELSAYGEPFYGFFDVQPLQGLTPEEGIEMLRNFASEDGDERMKNALSHPGTAARVQAVQILAGGNPRVLVVLYDFLRAGSDFRVVDALYKTIDAMTPYYQSLIQDRSPQQRKILVLLCESPAPVNVATIAERCSMTHQVASSQLKQLRDDRFVTSREVGRESRYTLTEPFLRICWEAKSQTGGPLPVLVELLAYWYRYDELAEMSRTADPESSGYWSGAIALRESGRLEVPSMTMEQRLHGDQWVAAGAASGMNAADREQFEAYCREYAERRYKHPQYWWGRLRAMLPPGEDSPEENEAVVSPLLDRIARAELIASLELLTEEGDGRMSDPAVQARAIGAVAAVLEARGETREALRIREQDELPKRIEAGDRVKIAAAKLRVGDLLYRLGELDRALGLWREECLPAFTGADKAHVWGRIADVLQARGDFDEALRIRKVEELPVYDKIGEIRDRAVAWGKIADVLQDRGDFDEALRIRRAEELPVYEKIDDIRSRAVAWGRIADVLQARGDFDEALRIRKVEQLPVYDKIGDIRSRAVTWGKIADVLQARGNFDEALRIRKVEQLPVYDKIGDIRARAITWGKIADVLQARGDFDEALRIRKFEELPVYEKIGDIRERALTLSKIANRLADADEAIKIYESECLPVAHKLGHRPDLQWMYRNLAKLLRRRGKPGDAERAAGLEAESRAIAEALKLPQQPRRSSEAQAELPSASD